MTNDEVKQFFKDNGAYYEFKIQNSPMFVHYDIVPDEKTGGFKSVSSTHSVDTISIIDIHSFIFTNMNNMKKWYIYNDMQTNFNLDMKYIRAKGVEDHDYIKLRIRSEKIDKIIERINDKKIRGNRFLYAQ